MVKSQPQGDEKPGEANQPGTRKSKLALSDSIDDLVRRIGHLVCWANACVLLLIILQVLLRYGFSNGQTFLEELQWHFYGGAVMVGLSYAVVTDSHVRVDVFYSRFTDRVKAVVGIISVLIFILPFAYIVFYHSLDFVADAWRVSESSDSAGGLPHRFIVKSVIPISFGLLMIAALSRLVRDVNCLMSGD